MKPEIETLFDPATQTLTHIVWIPSNSNDAVVIDPVLDYDAPSSRATTRSLAAVLDVVASRGLKVHAVLETHAHADHLTAGRVLADRLGCATGIGAGIRTVQATFARLLKRDFAIDGSQFDRVFDDEVVAFGALELRVIATPGHTPSCVSYLVGDALFTGDALFIEDYGTGRCDFPGGDAAALFRSVRHLYTLPPETRVFPCHDYQPGGRPLRTWTTIGASRAANVQLSETTGLDAFVAFRQARDAALPAPKLLWPAIQVNVDGGRLPPYLTIPLRVVDVLAR